MSVLDIDGVVTKESGFLTDAGALSTWLYELAELIGMHAVSLAVEPYAHWPNGAPSAVLFIEESAIIVHAYPEADYIELTLHSCKAIPEPELVAERIIKFLGLDVRFYRYEAARDWQARVVSPYKRGTWPRRVLEARQP